MPARMQQSRKGILKKMGATPRTRGVQLCQISTRGGYANPTKPKTEPTTKTETHKPNNPTTNHPINLYSPTSFLSSPFCVIPVLLFCCPACLSLPALLCTCLLPVLPACPRCLPRLPIMRLMPHARSPCPLLSPHAATAPTLAPTCSRLAR